MTYDIIVLGSGPAGLAAAVGARGRGKRVLVIGNRWQDSPLARAEQVDNYLGLPGRTGHEMLEEFQRHAEQLGTEFLTGKAISLMAWKGFMVTVGSQVYDSRALILAPGVIRQAKYPGEEENLGRGVSYCATCDGMLYRNKPVVVVGRSPDAPHEANYLKSLGCQVTYVAAREPQGLDQEIPFVRAGRLAVKGEQAVTALETEEGYIRVDRRMATNVEGVFAAGDCTGGPLQVAKAVGEGHVAALSACEYLDQIK